MSRILYITQYASFIGGIERYEAATGALLRQNGHEVSLWYMEKGNSFDDFAKNFTRTITAMPEKKDFDCVVIHKLTDPYILEELINTFGSKLCAVIHDHDAYCPRSHYYTPFGRKNCHRKYSFARCSLCAMARNPASFKNGAIKELVSRTCAFKRYYTLLHKIEHLIVLSSFMKQNLVLNGFNPAKISIIHPFTTRLQCPAAKTVNAIPRIGFTGQLVKGKGPDTFLEMLTHLKHKYTAVVTGTGNELENLRTYAAENRLPVEFKGYVAEPEKVMASLDILVFPFRWQEPFGLVGIEAAAAGIPVVAFTTGGVKEWLKDGFNGLAVSPGSVEELALAVDGLLENHYTRRELGKNGIMLARTEFQSENYLAAMNSFLDSLPESSTK